MGCPRTPRLLCLPTRPLLARVMPPRRPSHSAAGATLLTNSVAAVLALPRYLTNNHFQFSLTGVPGFTYAIQASTNLADWISLGTNSSPFIFLDYEASDFPQRFYRALYVP